MRAVDEALAGKHLTKVESGGDLIVTYHAAVDKSLDVQSFGYTGGMTYGYGGWYGGSYYPERPGYRYANPAWYSVGGRWGYRRGYWHR